MKIESIEGVPEDATEGKTTRPTSDKSGAIFKHDRSLFRGWSCLGSHVAVVAQPLSAVSRGMSHVLVERDERRKLSSLEHPNDQRRFQTSAIKDGG